ncbi:hypothetical protein D3C76_112660 [compost metagenome]
MNQRNNNTSWKSSPRPQSSNRDERRPQRSSNFGSLETLREITVAPRKPQVQPEPLKFEGAVNAWYKTVRNGATHKVFLVEVKKDQVTFKDQENDKHSQSMSLAKFMKFYQPV